MRYRDQIYLTQSEEVCWTTSHLLFSDILQPQFEPDLRWRCSSIGCSVASEPEPSDTRVSPTLHVLLLKRCTLVLQQWLCTLVTGVAVHGWFWLKLLKCMVQFSLVPRFSVGGETWACYPLFARALQFPEILGDQELSYYIRTSMTFVTYLLLHHLHIFWPMMELFWSFILLHSLAPSTGRYFWYESHDSTGSFHFGRLLVKYDSYW